MKRQFNSRFGVLVPEHPHEASSPLFIGIHKNPTFYPRSERGVTVNLIYGLLS